MIKKLVVGATLLLMQDAQEIIQFARAILDFKMLAQYILHDDETLPYMEYALNKLEKRKYLSNIGLLSPS